MAMRPYNEKAPFGAILTPALTGCPPAERRITYSLARFHGKIKRSIAEI